MTDQEIAQALENMIREDAKRPPDAQIRELIESGVIDEQGRILIAGRNKNSQDSSTSEESGPSAQAG